MGILPRKKTQAQQPAFRHLLRLQQFPIKIWVSKGASRNETGQIARQIAQDVSDAALWSRFGFSLDSVSKTGISEQGCSEKPALSPDGEWRAVSSGIHCFTGILRKSTRRNRVQRNILCNLPGNLP